MADKAYRVVKSDVGVKSDVKGMNEKIRKHRRKILSWAAFAAIASLLTIAGIYIYLQTRTYSDYDIIKSVKREDSPGTQFDVFHGNILKYSSDGASLVDADNKTIWNQTYEMQSPMTDSCENYVVIADRKGDTIYIMDISGPCGEIKSGMPIQGIQVAYLG